MRSSQSPVVDQIGKAAKVTADTAGAGAQKVLEIFPGIVAKRRPSRFQRIMRSRTTKITAAAGAIILLGIFGRHKTTPQN